MGTGYSWFDYEGPHWTHAEIQQAAKDVHAYFAGVYKPELERILAKYPDADQRWKGMFTSDMSKRIALQKYGQLNERAVRYDADCPRVLQRVAAHWNTYIERVIKQRNPEDREKVVAMAKEGPAAFYIFLVTDLLWRAWRTHSPSMEASIQSIHMKIGFDNQYLWNMKELAEILPK